MKNDYLIKNRETYDKSAGFAESMIPKLANVYSTIVKKLKRHLKKEDNILEIGPGNGYMSKLLSENGHKVTAIEFSKERAKLARKTAPKAKIINDEFLTHHFKNNEYGIIVALELIHLFPKKELEKLMKKIYKLLKKNGLIVVNTTIEKKSQEGFMKRIDGLIRYRRSFTKKELEIFLEKNNFKIIDKFDIKRTNPNNTLMNYICKK